MNRRHFMEISALTPTLAVASNASAAEKPPIGIAQIGVAHAHAAGKMAVYRESTDFEVLGIAEADPDLAARAAATKTYEELNWMGVEDLLQLDGLKAVAIESDIPDLLHYAELAIDAGKHIHIDKPPGGDMERFRNLMQTAEAKGLTVQQGYMYRYNPAILLLQDFLRKGWLGEVFEVHAVMSKVVPPAGRADLARFRGGIMFELGCHLIDLVVGVLGKPLVVTPWNRKVVRDGLVDNMLAVLEYPKALATVKSTAVEVDGFARRHLVVCGTRGTVHIQPLDRPSMRVTFDQPRGPYSKGYQDIEFEPYQRYVGDAADLAAIIRGEKETDFSVEHDLAVQDTVLRSSGLL